MWRFGLYALSILYVLAGLNHFRAPNFYRPLMPPYLPAHDILINVSGVIEVILGLLLLWPPYRPWAAWGIVLLLIAIMPVHIFMVQERSSKFVDLPAVFLWLRIPAQGLLVWWAYIYTASLDT